VVTFVPVKIFLSAAILLLLFSACKRDQCKDVVCPAQKVCYDGNCICPAGYEGSLCDTLSRQKMIGNYFVGENCPGSGAQNYYSNITEGVNAEQIEINNIVNSGLFCDATVSENSVYIPDQQVGGIQLSGQGSFNEQLNQLILYIDYSISGSLKQCTLTMVKQ
jgi:hypothetical protein